MIKELTPARRNILTVITISISSVPFAKIANADFGDMFYKMNLILINSGDFDSQGIYSKCYLRKRFQKID